MNRVLFFLLLVWVGWFGFFFGHKISDKEGMVECRSRLFLGEERCNKRVDDVFFRMCVEEEMPVGGGGEYSFGG